MSFAMTTIDSMKPRFCGRCWLVGLVAIALFSGRGPGAEADAAKERFLKDVQPVLKDNCYSCHGGNQKKGNVSLDARKTEAILRDPALWARALRNVRAGIMPPAKYPRLSAEELKQLESWIKTDGFGLDPRDPDPGRVTLRRLNRIEYRNTIRDLLGVDYDTSKEFPADDTGYGFDNIGDVLTVSPLLLEKYIQAAKSVVAAVPTATKVDQEQSIWTAELGRSLPYRSEGKVAEKFKVEKEGNYRLVVVVEIRGRFEFDSGKCAVRYQVDDQERLAVEYPWYERKTLTYQFEQKWQPGEHTLAVGLKPLTPEGKKTAVTFKVASAKVVGPLGK
jgi:mono/diheme cytochrome c family protein